MQDTEAANAQGAFGANYRDLVFVDAWNRKLILTRTINLDPDKDNLSFEVNRGVVKGILRIIAEMTDVDEDGVADDWEERFLGGLDENVGSDLDGDGEDLLLEYGLGSHPGEKGSLHDLGSGSIIGILNRILLKRTTGVTPALSVYARLNHVA